MSSLRRFATAAALLGAAAVPTPGFTQTPSPAPVPDWSLAARLRLQAGPGANPPEATAERQRLIDEGEARLAVGDTAAAQSAFERAAQTAHAADIELALVRVHMQAGDYERALSFGAHAAGAHLELPEGTGLYAWLLHVGGQGRYAEALLVQTLTRAPGNPMLEQVRAELKNPWPTAGGGLSAGPARVAPAAWGATVAAGAAVVGSATLADAGDAAWAPTAVLAGAQRLWLRNGLGQTVTARIDRPGEILSRLTLSAPLSPPLPVTAPAPAGPAPRPPFAGSPGYTVEYAPGNGARAAWPLLRQGFFGAVTRDGGPRPLGIEVPPGARGGPVFDAAGRLVGIAFVDATGIDRWAPPPADLDAASPIAMPLSATPASTSAAAARMPVAAVYELGLRRALQLIVLR